MPKTNKLQVKLLPQFYDLDHIQFTIYYHSQSI